MVDELLLWTLEDLGEDDFGTFKWYLDKENLDGVEPIPKSKLECANRTKTVSQMTRSYVEETAMKVAVEILRKMRNMNAAEKLTKKYAEMNRAALSLLLLLCCCCFTSSCFTSSCRLDVGSGRECDRRSESLRLNSHIEPNHQ
ncbi:Caspase b [Dissostichus eleginoides]|uniref:Caspase b n=1 Tax=Dissostichus eleginoides TaxID=100907 RepID=A0AAD9CBW9_DISEL|nr:Caspase b [Dissostichus eleginoides]